MNLKRLKRDKRTELDKRIDEGLGELSNLSITSESYDQAAKNVETLCKARSYEKPRKVSPDAVLSAVVSIGGILLILGYEQTRVITSKAFHWIPKGRF